MAKNLDHRPRLSIELTDEQFFRLQRNMPWGTKNRLFCALVDQINDLVEKHGQIALGAIFSGSIRITIDLKE